MAANGTIAMARRRFLMVVGGVAAAATASVIPGHLSEAISANRTVYFLDPEWGEGDPACPDPHQGSQSCHACNACHRHDANKMWTSASLANQNRAHVNCKCIVTSKAVSNAEFVTIFGPRSGPLHRDEFDMRRDRLFLPPQALERGY